jgi:hypothetical protein
MSDRVCPNCRAGYRWSGGPKPIFCGTCWGTGNALTEPQRRATKWPDQRRDWAREAAGSVQSGPNTEQIGD